MNIYKSCALKGCLIPSAVLLLLLIIWLFWNWRQTFYIQDFGLYVRIDRIPFCDVKMSFSKDKTFGDDYIKYRNSYDVVSLDVYYIPPKTICVSGASDVKQDALQIIEYGKRLKFTKPRISEDGWVQEVSDEYSDSTFIKKPSYHFLIFNYSSGFYLRDPEDRIIFKAGYKRWF